MRPVSTSIWYMCGMETRRLISWRGAQKGSSSVTWVKETGVSWRLAVCVVMVCWYHS